MTAFMMNMDVVGKREGGGTTSMRSDNTPLSNIWNQGKNKLFFIYSTVLSLTKLSK